MLAFHCTSKSDGETWVQLAQQRCHTRAIAIRQPRSQSSSARNQMWCHPKSSAGKFALRRLVLSRSVPSFPLSLDSALRPGGKAVKSGKQALHKHDESYVADQLGPSYSSSIKRINKCHTLGVCTATKINNPANWFLRRSKKYWAEYKFDFLYSSLCLFSIVRISMLLYLSSAQVFLHLLVYGRGFSVKYYKPRIQLNITLGTVSPI